MSPRTYVVPRNVQQSTCWLGASATMDEIELAATVLPAGPAGTWARSVVNRATVRGVEAAVTAGGAEQADIIHQHWAVENEDGLVTGVTITASGGPDDVKLSLDETVSVRRMLSEGAEGVLVRPWAPVAIIRERYATSPVVAAAEVPEGAVEIAIVDELDRTAVLELLAVAPGPEVLRRHDGQWQPDAGWVDALKSVKPPPMVKLSGDDAMRASVEQQVDEATAGQPFEPLTAEVPQGEAAPPEVSPSEELAPVAASVVQRYARGGDDFAVQMALTAAVDVGEMKNPVATERLRQYWLHGKGAAKIRWGTPGAWTRCRRLLSKHMPPTMVPGYCTNLSQRLGGPGIATHVGDVNPVKRVLPG